MRHIVIDIESQHLANDPEIGGWKNLHMVGVACAVVYQFWSKRFRIYGDSPTDLAMLKHELEVADRISGFNIARFDLPVIYQTPKGQPLPTDGKVDDLQDRIIYGLGGHPVTDAMRHGKYNLDLICRSTLGVGKIAEGIAAPEMWRSKRFAELHNYCLTPDPLLLGQDLRWAPAHDFALGDIILGFDEYGPRRQYRAASILSIEYEDAQTLKVEMESGQIFYATPEHGWLTWKQGNDKLYRPRWETTTDLLTAETRRVIPRLLSPWKEQTSKEDGWLEGMLDGEGALVRNRVLVAQNPGKILDRLMVELAKHVPVGNLRQVKNDSGCMVIGINGGFPESMRLLGRIRPARLLDKIDFDALGWMQMRPTRTHLIDRVVNVEPAGKRTIVKIATSSRTFIADGYAMHNCCDDVALERDLCWHMEKNGFVMRDAERIEVPAWTPAAILPT